MTVTITNRSKNGRQKITTATVAMDSSYPTGGETLTPAMLGLNQIDILVIDGGNGYRLQYDYTNSKLMSYTTAATQTTNTTDLSALTLKIQAYGS